MINIFIRPKWVLSLLYAFDFWINCIHQSGNDFQRKHTFRFTLNSSFKKLQEILSAAQDSRSLLKKTIPGSDTEWELRLDKYGSRNGVILNYIFTFGNLISKVIKDEGLSNLMAFYVKQEVTRINWMIPNIVTSVVRVKLFFTRIDFFVPFDWRLKFRSFIALCLLQTLDWCMIPAWADKVSCQ